jgi:hypothetical protein
MRGKFHKKFSSGLCKGQTPQAKNRSEECEKDFKEIFERFTQGADNYRRKTIPKHARKIS